MFRFTISKVLLLAVIAGLAGCGRTSREIETIRQGAEDVDRHAKEIEKAAEPNGVESAQ